MSSQAQVDSEQEQKHKSVIFSYGKMFILSAVLAGFATSLAVNVNGHFPCPVWLVRFLQVLGAVVEVTALGSPGWELQTWDGDTPVERLNNILNKCFALGGFFLLVFSWQLKE